METIRLGSTGSSVVVWQKLIGATPDGQFGPKTEAATKAWQTAKGLVADGIVGPKSWAAAGRGSPVPAVESGKIAFKQAKYYTPGRPRPVDLVVIHVAECGESSQAAENLASWGANKETRKASWHFAVDNDSTTQSVRESDRAWHAGHLNGRSIGIELSGRASQSASDWADLYSLAVLDRAAELTADLCRRYSIPPVKLTPREVKQGKPGICGHVDETIAYAVLGGHVDPGPCFPWLGFINRIRKHLGVPEDPGVDTSGFVEISHEGSRYLVAPEYIYPVGIGEAQQLALALGCELPSPGLVNAIWKTADLKVAPGPMSPNKGNNFEQFTARAEVIEAQIRGKAFKLLAGTHKDVVLSEGKACLYGWHRLDGSVIQPVFGGHSLSYIDYSQGLRRVVKLA